MNSNTVFLTNGKQIDMFNDNTYNGYKVEFKIVLGEDRGTILIPGMIKSILAYDIHKNDAFQLLHNLSVMTYNEVRNYLDNHADCRIL